jgi:hypothetical protein
VCACAGIGVYARKKLQQAVRTAMRGTMPADVAAERQLNVIERLLALMPRSRGFQVKADASTAFYIYRDYPGILIVLIPFWSGMG